MGRRFTECSNCCENVFGAKVIALVGDLALTGQLKALGATHVLSYKSDSLVDDILAVNGGPVDSVLDVVGDALFETSLTVLKKGGKFCISGSSGGQITQLDFRTLYLKHITAYGSVLGTVAELKQLLKAVAKGQVKPVIDCVFDLKDAKDAQLYFKEKDKLHKSGLNPVTTKKRTTTH